LNKILIATRNEGKIKEFDFLFNQKSKTNELYSLKFLEKISGISYSEPEEKYDSFILNALSKLYSASEFLLKCEEKSGSKLDFEIVVDDSGLCVPKLNFRPGVHSAKLAGEPRNDARNNEALKKILESELGLTKNERIPAFFVSFLLIASSQSWRNFAAYSNCDEFTLQLVTMLEAFERTLLESLNNKKSIKGLSFKLPIDIVVNGSIGTCKGFVGTVGQDSRSQFK
jgi:inosine/xanthosine triphosphate pyrophosphatase family protein